MKPAIPALRTAVLPPGLSSNSWQGPPPGQYLAEWGAAHGPYALAWSPRLLGNGV